MATIFYKIYPDDFEAFGWDEHKAASNLQKHGVTFERADEVFRDPFAVMADASRQGEERSYIIGSYFIPKLLLVVFVE
jgi:uncharacterized protein